MKKEKVVIAPCICGHHAWYGSREIATISKHGSVRWEINDADKLPVDVLSKVNVFAAEIARKGV